MSKIPRLYKKPISWIVFKLKRAYLRIKFRKQIKQGHGLLHDVGEKVELTHIMQLTRKGKK